MGRATQEEIAQNQHFVCKVSMEKPDFFNSGDFCNKPTEPILGPYKLTEPEWGVLLTKMGLVEKCVNLKENGGPRGSPCMIQGGI